VRWGADKVKGSDIKKLVRNFAIEVVVYAVLVLVYFLLVLRFLGQPLARLFSNNLLVYAVVALVLIVVQGVVLEAVTSFIMGLLGLDKLE
jgi:hypothetical protein